MPKTYEDLLDPQWTGQNGVALRQYGPLSVHDQPAARLGRGEGAGLLQKLAEQKIINFASGSARTLVDRVIAGEYPIAINIYAHHPLISAGKGAPVNSQLMDPVPSASGIAHGRSRAPNIRMLPCCSPTSS